MSVEQLARKHGLTVHALIKRIQRGTPLDKPLQRRTKRPPCPITWALRGWTSTHTLAALGVRRNLKARI